MTPRIMRRDERRGIAPSKGLTFGMIILWTCALALVLAVVSHAQIDAVDAATELRPEYEPMPAPADGGGELGPDNFCAAPGISGDHGTADIWAAEMGNAIGPGSVMPVVANEAEMEPVWSADMTVAVAAKSDFPGQLLTGYFPLESEYHGDLDDTTFAVDGMDYTVDAIFEADFGIDSCELVLGTNEPLPVGLVLEIGDDRFDLSESLRHGRYQTVHAWTLEESLGWEEGAIMPVALIKLPEPDPGPGPIGNTDAVE